jgi:hypothetical protein
MALRARLAPPPPKPQSVWPYHTAKLNGDIAAVNRALTALSVTRRAGR